MGIMSNFFCGPFCGGFFRRPDGQFFQLSLGITYKKSCFFLPNIFPGKKAGLKFSPLDSVPISLSWRL